MDSSAWPVLAGLFGTVAGVAATYLAARRQTSGSIDTSEAATLWGASEAIRRDMAAELAAVRAEMTTLRAEVSALLADNVVLRREAAHREEDR